MWGWLLKYYARLALRRPRLPLALAAILTVAAAVLVPRLEVITARSKIVGSDDPHQVRADRFNENFGGSHNLVVLVRAPDAATGRTFVDRLAQEVAREREVVKSVFHRLDLDALKERMLLYLPVKVLEGMRDALASAALPLDDLARQPGLVGILEAVERAVAGLLSGKATASIPAGKSGIDPFTWVARFFREMEGSLSRPGRRFPPSLEDLYAKRLGLGRSGFDRKGYLGGKKPGTFLLFVEPRAKLDSAENQSAFTKRVRAVVTRLTHQSGGRVRAGVTGLPASNADEMLAVGRDGVLMSVAAFVGIGLVFLFAFGFSFRNVIALVPVAAGTLWSFGFVSAAVGHLTMISSVFSVVLFGLGADFGMHIMARFEEEWERTGDPRKALERALVDTGQSVITGALATSIAFFTVMTSDVEAFAELGLITGTGLLLVMLSAFLTQPALLLWWAGRVERSGRPELLNARGKAFGRVVGGWVRRRALLLVIVAAAITAFFAIRAPGIPFNYNFLEMLPKGSEAARYHRELITATSISSEFNAVFARTIAEARAKTEVLRRAKSVGRIESVISLVPPGQDPSLLQRRPASRSEALAVFLPPGQAKKLRIIGAFAPRLRRLPNADPRPAGIDRTRLLEALGKLADRLDAVLEAVPLRLAKPVAGVVRAVAALRKAVVKSTDLGGLRAFEGRLLSLRGEALALLRRMARVSRPITTADLVGAAGGIFGRLVGKDGRYAIYAFPAGPVWRRSFLKKFVDETTVADPEVTGFPVAYYYISERIQRGFRWAALYAALAIAAFLLLELRRLGYALLAAVPVAVGATWMLGLMDLFGLEYNLGNIVALPLIVGMGVEYGVEMVHRFKESGGRFTPGIFQTTARAILVAGLTTLVALGSMGLASHRGLASLGLILICGITSCLLTAIVFLPAIMSLVARRRGPDQSEPPAR